MPSEELARGTVPRLPVRKRRISLQDPRSRRLRSRGLAAGLVLGLVLGGTLAAVAASHSGGDVALQQIFSSSRQTSTMSTLFRNVPGLSGLGGCIGSPPGALSILASLELTGAPVQLRIIAAGDPLGTGPASFDPTARTRSFSYTFAGMLSKGTFQVSLQWRSPTGAKVTLDRGQLVWLQPSCG